MKHIYFATSNQHKFDEARSYLEEASSDITLDRLTVDIPEIQSDDSSEVLRQKIEYVRQLTELPFIVDDAYFETDRYPGFPGAYAKFVNSTLKREGWERLFDEGDSIRAVANIALYYLGTVITFSGSVEGSLHFDESRSSNEGNLLSDMMRISPDLTLGNALNNPDFNSHRGMAFSELAKWLNNQNRQSTLQKVDIGNRWSDRSTSWQDIIENKASYVNFEENYARVNAMIKKYAPLVSGDALEIGCGTGEAGRILKKANASLNVLSTDISDGMLAEASRQTRSEGLDIQYQKMDITSTDLDGREFDIVLSRGVVISHLPRADVIDWLKAVSRSTKPGGYFIFDFIQSVQVGDIEKPVDSKNEFTLRQMNLIMKELGWSKVENDGTDEMRVQVVSYRKDG